MFRAEHCTDPVSARRAGAAARKALGDADRAAANSAIGAHIGALLRQRQIVRLGSYSAIGSEADPAAGLTGLPELEIHLPRVRSAQQPLDYVRIDASTHFQRSALGVDEPVGGTPVAAAALQLLLIPLLAFDRQGTRVGYGGGYYDRTLAECAAQRPLRVGVAYACQEFAQLQRQRWDQPLHLIVTEKEVIECPTTNKPSTGC